MYLIGLRFASGTLDVDSRISRPRCLIHPVTRTGFTWLAKIVLADFAELVEANPFGIAPHLGQNVLSRSHRIMVSLLILLSRTGLGRLAEDQRQLMSKL